MFLSELAPQSIANWWRVSRGGQIGKLPCSEFNRRHCPGGLISVH
jgi:hypothetical protein